MNGKHRRDKRTAPKRAGHLPQNQKKRDDRRGVEEDIGEVMSAGIQSVKLAVQHVGKPSQWMPVGRVKAGEGPGDSLEGQTLRNHRILKHIFIVVVENELVMQRLAENDKGDRGQHKAHPRHLPVPDRPEGRWILGGGDFRRAIFCRFMPVCADDDMAARAWKRRF